MLKVPLTCKSLHKNSEHYHNILLIIKNVKVRQNKKCQSKAE